MSRTFSFLLALGLSAGLSACDGGGVALPPDVLLPHGIPLGTYPLLSVDGQPIPFTDAPGETFPCESAADPSGRIDWEVVRGGLILGPEATYEVSVVSEGRCTATRELTLYRTEFGRGVLAGPPDALSFRQEEPEPRAAVAGAYVEGAVTYASRTGHRYAFASAPRRAAPTEPPHPPR